MRLGRGWGWGGWLMRRGAAACLPGRERRVHGGRVQERELRACQRCIDSPPRRLAHTPPPPAAGAQDWVHRVDGGGQDADGGGGGHGEARVPGARRQRALHRLRRRGCAGRRCGRPPGGSGSCCRPASWVGRLPACLSACRPGRVERGLSGLVGCLRHSPACPMNYRPADIDKTARDVVASSHRNAGQTCICTNRVFVHVSPLCCATLRCGGAEGQGGSQQLE